MPDASTLSRYLREQIFVAFDTETTGLWAPSNRVVELAAVKFRLGDGEIDTLQSLVNPQREIPADVIKIHGITNEAVADAPLAGDIMRQFIAYCGSGSILLAHNAPFDISFVGCELDRNGLIFGDNIILDTTDIFRRLFPGQASYSLLSLSRHFALTDSQSHRALDDARLVRLLFEIAASQMASVQAPADFSNILSTYRMTDWRASEGTLPDQFADLNRALRDGLRVEMVYATPSNEPTSRVIRPAHFYHLGSVYYINAFCERVQEERTFRLDRIVEYQVLD